MNLEKLHAELKTRNISEENYYLHGLFGSTSDENKIALAMKKGKYTTEYEVYYNERGEKHSEKLFTSESEACEYVLNQLLEQYTIEKTQNLRNIDGMSVNERLSESGLLAEFNQAKKTNRKRAAQILRILKVDKSSAEKILNKKNWWQQWL